MKNISKPNGMAMILTSDSLLPHSPSVEWMSSCTTEAIGKRYFELKSGSNFIGRYDVGDGNDKKISRKQLLFQVEQGLLYQHVTVTLVGTNPSVFQRTRDGGFKEKFFMARDKCYPMAPGDTIYLTKDTYPLKLEEIPSALLASAAAAASKPSSGASDDSDVPSSSLAFSVSCKQMKSNSIEVQNEPGCSDRQQEKNTHTACATVSKPPVSPLEEIRILKSASEHQSQLEQNTSESDHQMKFHKNAFNTDDEDEEDVQGEEEEKANLDKGSIGKNEQETCSTMVKNPGENEPPNESRPISGMKLYSSFSSFVSTTPAESNPKITTKSLRKAQSIEKQKAISNLENVYSDVGNALKNTIKNQNGFLNTIDVENSLETVLLQNISGSSSLLPVEKLGRMSTFILEFQKLFRKETQKVYDMKEQLEEISHTVLTLHYITETRKKFFLLNDGSSSFEKELILDYEQYLVEFSQIKNSSKRTKSPYGHSERVHVDAPFRKVADKNHLEKKKKAIQQSTEKSLSSISPSNKPLDPSNTSNAKPPKIMTNEQLNQIMERSLSRTRIYQTPDKKNIRLATALNPQPVSSPFQIPLFPGIALDVQDVVEFHMTPQVKHQLQQLKQQYDSRNQYTSKSKAT